LGGEPGSVPGMAARGINTMNCIVLLDEPRTSVIPGTVHYRAPAKKVPRNGQDARAPEFFAQQRNWSAGVPPAMRTTGSRTASFISARRLADTMTIPLADSRV
jgi:hypothetical protein